MSDEAKTTMKQITRRKFLGGLTLAGISVPMVGAVAAGQSQRPSRQITQKQYEAMTAAALCLTHSVYLALVMLLSRLLV